MKQFKRSDKINQINVLFNASFNLPSKTIDYKPQKKIEGMLYSNEDSDSMFFCGQDVLLKEFGTMPQLLVIQNTYCRCLLVVNMYCKHICCNKSSKTRTAMNLLYIWLLVKLKLLGTYNLRSNKSRVSATMI